MKGESKETTDSGDRINGGKKTKKKRGECRREKRVLLIKFRHWKLL